MKAYFNDPNKYRYISLILFNSCKNIKVIKRYCRVIYNNQTNLERILRDYGINIQGDMELKYKSSVYAIWSKKERKIKTGWNLLIIWKFILSLNTKQN